MFLDRDGVINEKPAPDDYIRSHHEFRLLPNMVDWIRLFKAGRHSRVGPLVARGAVVF